MSGAAVRGSRPGAGPAGEPERGEAAPRTQVSFWCASGHETLTVFSADAAVPGTWECVTCGKPAGQDKGNPPPPPRTGPAKTHLAYLKERRSAADGEAILDEALARLRGTAPARPPVPDQLARLREPPPAPPSLPGARGRSAKVQGDPRPAQRHGPARRSPEGGRAAPRRRSSAGQEARVPGGAPGRAGPPGGPAEAWCDDCGYRLTAPSHRRICLGEW